MKIPHRARAIIVAGAGIAGLGASLAFASASTTWTVNPGGTDSANAGVVTLTDAASGVTLTCAASQAISTSKSGSGLSGQGIAVVNQVSFSGCSGLAGTSLAVSSQGTWVINAQTFSSSGVATGTVTNVNALISGSGCGALVTGTAAGTYSDSTGVVQMSGGSLHLTDVSGCSGMLRNGDPVSFSGSYTASPRQTVSSP